MDKCNQCHAPMDGGDNACTEHDDCEYCDPCCAQFDDADSDEFLDPAEEDTVDQEAL